ncbi:MAG: hypothetical protein ACYCYP_07695 [Leptospirales bacterium]
MSRSFFSCVLSFFIMVLISFSGARIVFALPPSGSSTAADSNVAPDSVSASDQTVPISSEEGKFDETFGKFGLSIGFLYVFSQSPMPENFFANSLGGISELSYGVRTGVRILVGGGFAMDSPHVSPPLKASGNALSSDFSEGYLGSRLAMDPFFPQFFKRQPWIPYIRADLGGVTSSVSNSGSENGRSNGLMADVGLGVEGRAPEFPVGFFAEIRSQWFFLGPQTVTILPVVVGSTFYF